MKVYADASVVLRLILSEPNPLAQWNRVEELYVSRLASTEIGRTIDRLRLTSKLTELSLVTLHEESRRILATGRIVEVTKEVLEDAAGPMPITLGTLDAIHLASAKLVRQQKEYDAQFVFATHDQQLGRAARASGFEVYGV